MENGKAPTCFCFFFYHILGGILTFSLLPFLRITLIAEFGDRDVGHLNYAPYCAIVHDFGNCGLTGEISWFCTGWNKWRW